MTKLFKLREWLTITDSARHLSIILNEELSAADVLRLALDNHLTISVLFVNHAFARPCIPTKPEDILYDEVLSIDGTTQLKLPKYGRCWGDWRGNFQVAQNFVTELTGVWDLPLTDGGRADVEYQYHSLIGNPEYTAVTLEGVLVQNSHGALFEIQTSFKDNAYFKQKLKEPYNHPDNFYPAGGLPADAVLVVRTEALRAFEEKISEDESPVEKPLGTRERNTLLSIIAVLCEASGYDIARAAKTAVAISGSADLVGIDIGESTIEKHLKLIPDAVRRRQPSQPK